jgi:hypothetical protein
MFDSHAGTLSGSKTRITTRSGGVTGNARLTGAVAVSLLVLLAAEGLTVPFIGQLLGPHIFIGLLLVPPVAPSVRAGALAAAIAGGVALGFLASSASRGSERIPSNPSPHLLTTEET